MVAEVTLHNNIQMPKYCPKMSKVVQKVPKIAQNGQKLPKIERLPQQLYSPHYVLFTWTWTRRWYFVLLRITRNMRLTMIVANDIKNRTEDLITSSNVICAIFTSQISSLWQVTLAMGFGKITQSPIFEDMLAIFDSRQNIPSYPCLELYK